VVEAPEPVVAGTRLRVRGEGFIDDPQCFVADATLSGRVGDTELDASLALELLSSNELRTVVPEVVEGTFEGTLIVRFRSVDRSDDAFTARATVNLEMAASLAPSASWFEPREAYLEDRLIVEGSGFLDGLDEGSSQAVFDGTFVTADGDRVGVFEVAVPGELLRFDDRSGLAVPWSPHVAGVVPGAFDGTLTIRNEHADSTVREGAPLDVTIEQRETTLVGLTPGEVSLGQYLEVQGRGFIGAPRDREGSRHAATAIRLDGELIPCDGPLRECWTEAVRFEADLATGWSSGELLRYGVSTSSEGGELRSADFGIRQGFFVGSVTPLLSLGDDRREGVGLEEVTLTLGPVRQVVWVRFLPGFSESLEAFGLGAVEAEVRRRVIRRMQAIYCGPGDPDRCVNVEIRSEEPLDYIPIGFAMVDVGGPDPNGLGLLGYDGTVIRDVNNLRLWDHVGGDNALGGVDGSGYGGVFIESFLFYSEHPPFDDVPVAAPTPEPLFDTVFDPVRDREVVAGEYPAGADADRVAAIETAIHALSSLIADTAAHEFGHTLGLANPGLPDGPVHSLVDGEGCLMDAGDDRPFDERARLGGNPGARICDEDLAYLLHILPRD